MRIAVITGASSGLGVQFVRRLAHRQDLDEIWMIARRLDPMKALVKKISSPAVLRPVSMDLTLEEHIENYQKLLEEEKPDIRWLVNCAGFGKMGLNEEIPRKVLDDMVLLNCKAAMDMTQLSLPYMRRGSHILEICSTAAFMPLNDLGVYAATKSFLLSYSRSLHVELYPKGIMVTAVCPYWIKDTEFIPKAKNISMYSDSKTMPADSKAAVAGPRPSASGAKTAIRHFPLASRSKTVAAWAMRDALLGVSVSTPGIMCSLHRLVSKFIPHRLLMLAWDVIRRL